MASDLGASILPADCVLAPAEALELILKIHSPDLMGGTLPLLINILATGLVFRGLQEKMSFGHDLKKTGGLSSIRGCAGNVQKL